MDLAYTHPNLIVWTLSNVHADVKGGVPANYEMRRSGSCRREDFAVATVSLGAILPLQVRRTGLFERSLESHVAHAMQLDQVRAAGNAEGRPGHDDHAIADIGPCLGQ